MENDIEILRGIEKKLVAQLEQVPVFIQLERLRKTIEAFENTRITNGHVADINNGNAISIESSKKLKIPDAYSTTELTWKEKGLYIIHKLKHAGYADVVAEFTRLEPDRDADFLYKRTGVVLSHLKKDGLIDAVKEGKKIRYSIK